MFYLLICGRNSIKGHELNKIDKREFEIFVCLYSNSTNFEKLIHAKVHRVLQIDINDIDE